jgi:hypothetical protein
VYFAPVFPTLGHLRCRVGIGGDVGCGCFPDSCTSLARAHFHSSSTTPFHMRYLYSHDFYRQGDRVLRSSGSENISEAARKYNLNRSTLSKRFRGKTRSTAHGYQIQQLLTHRQEVMLVKQINILSEWCLPPTSSMVRAWAAALCGTEPGKNWAAAFV